MPNIKLYTSNRLEKLADQLSEIVRKPLSSPFIPEVIVVQSPGMERWISMQLAERLGIWSNCKYFFPNKIVSEIFSKTISGFTDERVFDTETAVWQIIKIMPQCLSVKGFESLRDYLANGDGHFRNFQLSSRIADTYDQYLTYRPDMILEWDKGDDNSWQAELWRMLMSGHDLLLPPDLKKSFFDKLKNPASIDFTSLPERISIFGISTMPKYHMDILSAISDYLTVNIFFMNPCREYWAEIYPEKNIAKAMGKYKDNVTADELHLEKGNSFLASMGRLGGDFLSMLTGYDNTQEYPEFTEPARDSLLHSIQHDILNMIDSHTLNESARIELTAADMESDTSIRVHSCHSPVRELEVLYDNLLDMFNTDPGLEPRDIIVMTPDIEIYSPYISAIFGDPHNEQFKIPFSIADKSIHKDNQTIKTFFAVIDLNNSRFESIKVLEILENVNVLNKFGIALSDLKLVQRWIKDTNINWGIDADFREDHGLPGFEENTWKAGLERILLGYAMPGNIDNMYQNILPYDIEGSESVILGKFIEFYNSLVKIYKSLSIKYTLSGWHHTLGEITEKIFDSKEDEDNIQIIRDTLGSLDVIEEKSGFHEEIELEVIKSWLENFFNRKRITSGFLTGGVTFCAMLPMRSIPFKVICLIGMNDSAFPAADNSVSFDLISQNPKRGDRSRRDDDRYLFLESIISAKRKLYISYVGQSIWDNSEIQPSVVVSELFDYIEGYAAKEIIIKNYIFVKHPLQPFSLKYFKNDTNLFSYSDVDRKACMTSISERKNAGIFVNGKLSNKYEALQQTVLLSDLAAFFTNPAKHLLTSKLGIYLDYSSDSLDEREPFTVEGIEKYLLEEIISRHYFEGFEIDNLYNLVRAGGLLPHGATGRALFDNIIPGVKDFSGRLKVITGKNKLEPIEINLDISGYKLSGRLDNVWPGGMIEFRYAKTKVKDKIKAWISHLALNASGKKACPMNSLLICKDASWGMESLGKSMDILKDLLAIYIKGQNELIRFFPESSYEYASSMLKYGSSEKALTTSEKKWTGDEYMPSDSERNNQYYSLCFGDILPFNDEFKEISMRVFGSMLNNQKKIEI